jgi:hypothetical protein
VRAAEAVLVHRGCSSAQVEYFLCAPQHSGAAAEPDDPGGGGGGGGAAVRYSARLQGWYRDRLGYRTVHRQGIGCRMRGYPATVPFIFEVGHKLLPGDGGGADESGGTSGATAYEHPLLQLRGRERALERARSALARVTEVSCSWACIGLPCLRPCVHGASI